MKLVSFHVSLLLVFGFQVGVLFSCAKKPIEKPASIHYRIAKAKVMVA